ncbi:MAG: RNA polymerase sigma factor [Halioglobus sp.]
MAEPDNTAYAADEARWSTLMVSAQSGHQADYRLLLDELSSVIKGYLVTRIGHQHFLDDCAQEILIAIHQARHTYDPGRRFRPWLFAIVRHKAIDALRKQNTLTKLKNLQAQEPVTVTAESIENHAISQNLINSLSDQHRDAITLTKLVGLSTSEAALQLSISESALKLRIHRGINKLRQLMEAEQL